MTDDLTPEERAYVEEILKRIRSKDRRLFAARDVRRLRQAITAQIGTAEGLNLVDRLFVDFKDGKI